MNVLEILQNKSIKKNIINRLEKYWESAGLPYLWISEIIEILAKYCNNPDLAIKIVREKFPKIVDDKSYEYSEKLREFRKIKVNNLALRLKDHINGLNLADIGGRADDLSEKILSLNKFLKKVYVTDIGSFSKRSNNPKINFIIQSSLTNIPFPKNTIDTTILSMVLHHINESNQNKFIENVIKSCSENGNLIIIEDTYPEKFVGKLSKNVKEYLGFSKEEKMNILYFYDWFGNRLMRNRDKISIIKNYKTMEEWKKIFEEKGMIQIKAEFVRENFKNPDIFPPKAIMIFKKKLSNQTTPTSHSEVIV